jgi:hypothetical protein
VRAKNSRKHRYCVAGNSIGVFARAVGGSCKSGGPEKKKEWASVRTEIIFRYSKGRTRWTSPLSSRFTPKRSVNA